MNTLRIGNSRTAWAIYVKHRNNDEYLFHSAHWSKNGIKEMVCRDWGNDGIEHKIFKIVFDMVQE